MSSEADKMWAEMTGGASKPSGTPAQPARTAPTSTSPPTSPPTTPTSTADTDLFPPAPAKTPAAGPASKPAIPAAAIYVAAAVVISIALVLCIWILTSKRASPAPVAGGNAPAQQTPAAPSRAGMLNLNTATAAQLRILPDVGPSLADKIIDYRTKHGSFRSVDQLDSVSGIGPKTMAKLRPLVYVE